LLLVEDFVNQLEQLCQQRHYIGLAGGHKDQFVNSQIFIAMATGFGLRQVSSMQLNLSSL